MARSEQKKYIGSSAITLANTTQYTEAFDISNYSGVAYTLKSQNASTSGTISLQYTNLQSATDADWTDVPTTVAPATVALVANGCATINTVGRVHAGFVRAKIVLAAGADSDYELYILAKDF